MKNEKLDKDMTPGYIRYIRNRECFALIDYKSALWYNGLPEEKRAELDAWYKAWLDAPATKVRPAKPDWLN